SATPPLHPLSLHDALPICRADAGGIHLLDTEYPGPVAEHARLDHPCGGADLDRWAGQLFHVAGPRTDLALATRKFIANPVHRGRSEEHTSELQSLRHLVCR